MLLENYANQSLLCNVSVTGETSTKNLFSFRGDMVIEEGDIADTQGRRHPPKAVVKQAVTLTTPDKIVMIAGAINDIGYLPGFIEKYQGDFADDIKLLFYVNNISQSLIVEIEGKTCTLIAHDEGAVWTSLMEDLRLEKEDFKGQSAEDKTLTMFEGLKDFSPKFPQITYDEALGFVVEITKEARGAI